MDAEFAKQTKVQVSQLLSNEFQALEPLTSCAALDKLGFTSLSLGFL